jgi:hypothetical protein
VLTRKRVFEKRFKGVVRAQKEGRRERRRSMSMSMSIGRGEEGMRVREKVKVEEPVDRSEFESRHSGPRDPTPRPVEGDRDREREEAVLDEEPHSPVLQFVPETPGSYHRVLSFVGVGAHPNSSNSYSHPASGLIQRSAASKKENTPPSPTAGLDNSQYPHYLTRHTTGRNAQFYGLSRAEREHLGGVEYRAITLLAYVVPIYFVLWQVLGCVGLGAYMAYHKAGVAESNGINPWYVSL